MYYHDDNYCSAVIFLGGSIFLWSATDRCCWVLFKTRNNLNADRLRMQRQLKAAPAKMSEYTLIYS